MARIGIDMLNVEKGDAYVIELYDDTDKKFVVVIDGGTSEKGEILVDHLKKYNNSKVNLAICSHPDTDHIGGLITMFQNCDVEQLILNDPQDIILKDKLLETARNNLSKDQVETFKSSLERIDDLKKEASNQYTTHYNLFSNINPILIFGGWSIYILSPSEELFKDIWLNEDVVKNWFNSDSIDISSVLNLAKFVDLDDPTIDTQPVNNSSLVILIEGYGKKYLFTGDAGKRALRDACNLKDISNLTWFDVPHHGSRRNVDNKLIAHFAPETAYISSPGTTKHPRRTVIKALQKTGAKVFSTCKQGGMHHNYNLQREGSHYVDPWEIL